MKINLHKTNIIKHDLSWVDYVRTLACLLVVLAHCCDPFVSSSADGHFFAGSLWGTFYRPSVPLFVMISGVLLLPTPLRIGEFYSRRLKRVLSPLIFWSILSPIIFYFFVTCIGMSTPTIYPEQHSLAAMLNNLWLWLFNFNYSTIPYWYIYMMLGLYLIIPIISSWVKDATKKELELVLKIWFFTTFVQYIQMVLPAFGYTGNYGDMGIFGACSWNSFTTFQYLSGFIGYLLLGHYFKKYPIQWSTRKLMLTSFAVWAVGYLITFEGFHYIRNNYPENFNMLEVPWSFTSFNVVMMTLPFFVLIQRLDPKPCKIVTLISEYSYAIFLTHFIMDHLAYVFVMRYIHVAPFFQLFICFLIGFALSFTFVAMLRRVPFVKRFVS